MPEWTSTPAIDAPPCAHVASCDRGNLKTSHDGFVDSFFVPATFRSVAQTASETWNLSLSQPLEAEPTACVADRMTDRMTDSPRCAGRPKAVSISSFGRSGSGRGVAGGIHKVSVDLPLAARSVRDNALSLPKLVEAIEQELRLPSDVKGPPIDKTAVLQQLLERFNDDWRDVERFAMADESRNYTRNLISTDHETYALILIVWNAGKYSPIHDHPCDGCWVHVIAGTVNEVRYARDDNRLVEIGNATLTRGATTYMEDSIGLHKIGNPSADTPAVTLHLYSPPYYKCRVWFDEEDADKSSEAHTCYFSEYGERADY